MNHLLTYTFYRKKKLQNSYEKRSNNNNSRICFVSHFVMRESACKAHAHALETKTIRRKNEIFFGIARATFVGNSSGWTFVIVPDLHIPLTPPSHSVDVFVRLCVCVDGYELPNNYTILFFLCFLLQVIRNTHLTSSVSCGLTQIHNRIWKCEK